MGLHTSRHTRKNSRFSTQDKHLVLLGLEALTKAPNRRYATRSIYLRVSSPKGQKTDSQRAELETWLKRHHYQSVQWFEDHESATTMQREAFQLCRHLGNVERISICLENAGKIAVKQGDGARAARLWGAAEALRENLGQNLQTHRPGVRERYLEDLSTLRLDERQARRWSPSRTTATTRLQAGGG